MHVTLSLIFVVFAFVLAFIAAIWREPAPPDPMRLRLVAAALACYFLSILVAGFNL